MSQRVKVGSLAAELPHAKDEAKKKKGGGQTLPLSFLDPLPGVSLLLT